MHGFPRSYVDVLHQQLSKSTSNIYYEQLELSKSTSNIYYEQLEVELIDNNICMTLPNYGRGLTHATSTRTLRNLGNHTLYLMIADLQSI
jgi:hypothetical protein